MKLRRATLLPSAKPLPRIKYKAVIAYDGTPYAGWQFQGNALGIQQVVEEALTWLNDGIFVRAYGSSRTDAGVHARGFVAHFHLAKDIPPKDVVRAINAHLPPSVRFMSAAKARDKFNAQFDAYGTEYRYHVYQAKIMPPHLAPYWTFCHRKLDVKAMQEAAAYFVGEHDFRSFAATASDRNMENTVRRVYSCDVKRAGHRYVIIVRGNGFLYKQVRSMAGFLIAVGKGRESPEAVKYLLEHPAVRTARVETAPACGLFLWKVFYRAPRGAKPKATP